MTAPDQPDPPGAAPATSDALHRLQSVVQPSISAMMSRRAPANAQGEVPGFGGSIMALGSIAAPLMLNLALAYWTSDAAPFRFAGAAFVIAKVFASLALIQLLRTPRLGEASPAPH